jgi:hypothetical protein
MAVAAIKSKRSSDSITGAILIEFERVLLPGANFFYEALNETLKNKKLEFDEKIFRHFFLNNTLKSNIQNLFFASDGDNPAIEKLIQQVTERYLKKISSFNDSLPKALLDLIKTASESNWKVVLITKLPQKTLSAFISTIDYMKKCDIHTLEDINMPFVFTTKKQWQSILNANKINQKSAIALTDNNSSLRSAVAIGISAVAIPHKLTEHQDFTGADIIVEDEKTLLLQDCVSLLTPVSFL